MDEGRADLPRCSGGGPGLQPDSAHGSPALSGACDGWGLLGSGRPQEGLCAAAAMLCVGKGALPSTTTDVSLNPGAVGAERENR